MLAFLQSLSGLDYTLIGMIVLLGALLVYFQMSEGNEYDVLDILKDTNGKASLDAHVIVFFGGLSAWYIISRTISGEDVGERLIEILGIFILHRVTKQAIAAYAAKPPAQPNPPAQVDQLISVSHETPANGAAKPPSLPPAIMTRKE